MKKSLSCILCFILAFVIISSCRKDFANENSGENPPPVRPDLTILVNTTVAGFLVDENDDPVMNAVVSAGNKQVNSDEFGYFRITNVSLPKTAGLVRVMKSGYLDAYRTILPVAGKEVFTRIKITPRPNSQVIDANVGGVVNFTGGGSITLPSSGVVVASSGASYSGQVHVVSRWINPSDLHTILYQSPGDLRGTDSEGHLTLLDSYSMLEVHLADGSGQKLQIAPGKQATISMPIPAAFAGTAPAAVKLWSFNEVTGLWKEEGSAERNGNNYTGEVSHFSFWTGATGIPLVEFTAQIVNSSLQPLANVPVGIRPAGQPFNAGVDQLGYTDINGVVYGSIPANWQLVMSVLTPCEIEAYSTNFFSGNSDIDLGVITANQGQGMMTITGTVTNCSGQPVTNGYVQTYDGSFNNRIPIVNGAFTFTGFMCSNTTSSYVAVDRDAFQQSITHTGAWGPGTINLGNISACGISTIGTLSFTIDGVTRQFAEPNDTLAAFYSNAGLGYTTILNLDQGQNANPDFVLQFEGQGNVTSDHKVTEIFSVHFPGGRAYAPVPLTVNITEFGLPGGFITGSFSGMMLDFPANGIHNVSSEFRIRRHH